MSVDTRAHIQSTVLQERAVLRRTRTAHRATGRDGRYLQRTAVGIQGRGGDEIRLSIDDLGQALRVLKVSARDLGYKR